MSKRHRSFIATLIGIATVAGGVGYGLAEQARYADDANYRAAEYAKHAAYKIVKSCERVGVVEQAKCLRDGAESYRLEARDKNREYADLVAQQTSALWTMIMGIAALIGMALSIIGVFLVYTTFRETRKANEISEDTAERQLRAYVAIKEVTMAPDPAGGSGTIRATAHFINVGQTPAKNLNSFMRFVVTPLNITPTPAQTFPEPLDTHSRVVLGPNIPNMITHTVVCGTVEAQTVLSGNYTLVADGYIQYDDIFDKTHRTCFRYYQNAETRGLGNAIVSAPVGNSLT